MDIYSFLPLLLSVLGVAIAMWAVWSQTRQNNLSLSATTLRDLEDDFLWSNRARQQRFKVATFLHNRGIPHGNEHSDIPPSEVAHLLDWLDQLGLYTKKGVVDLEMVWVTFFYWFGHYWVLLNSYASEFEKEAGGIEYYSNARYLYSRLCRFGYKKRNLPSDDIYFSEERLRAFLREEIEQWAE